MKIGRQREKKLQVSGVEQVSSDHRKDPQLPRQDILAVIIAMFQLFLPLIGGLILVGVVVALILH